MKSKLKKIGAIALFFIGGGAGFLAKEVSAQVLPVSKLKQEWCSKTMNYGGCSSSGNGSACSASKILFIIF